MASISLRRLCGYVWVNVFTLSPQRVDPRQDGSAFCLGAKVSNDKVTLSSSEFILINLNQSKQKKRYISASLQNDQCMQSGNHLASSSLTDSSIDLTSYS